MKLTRLVDAVIIGVIVLLKVCLTCPKLSGSSVIYWLEKNILMTSCFPTLFPKKCLQILEIFHIIFPPWKSMKWSTTQNNSSLFLVAEQWISSLGHNEVLMSLGRVSQGHIWWADQQSMWASNPECLWVGRQGQMGSSRPVVTLSNCNHSGGTASIDGQPGYSVCNNAHLKNSRFT